MVREAPSSSKPKAWMKCLSCMHECHDEHVINDNFGAIVYFLMFDALSSQGCDDRCTPSGITADVGHFLPHSTNGSGRSGVSAVTTLMPCQHLSTLRMLRL